MQVVSVFSALDSPANTHASRTYAHKVLFQCNQSWLVPYLGNGAVVPVSQRTWAAKLSSTIIVWISYTR